MKLIDNAKIEINILKAELKDANISSHKEDIIKKLETLYLLIDLYKGA